jgi:type I restriction enzyme S subunit
MLKLRWETKLKSGEYGRVPEDWEERTLGEVLRLEYGKGLPKRERKPGPFPVYGSSGVVGHNDSAYSKGPGLIIGRKGNVGSVFFSESDFFPIDTVFYSEKVQNAAFLYYVISKIDLKQLMSDSAVPGINIQFLNGIKIPYPGNGEQTRIAAFLSYFDQLIENKKRQNEILEGTALATFKNMFVDFAPFKDKPFTDSPLGKIPSDWQVKPIGELSELENGYPYSSNEKYDNRVEGAYLFVTLNNIVQGGGFKSNYSWIRSDKIPEGNFVRENDLILTNIHFGVGGSDIARLFATPAIVIFPSDYDKEKAVFSMDITRITPFKTGHRLFLYLYLKLTREDSVSFSTGTSILHLDLENFRQNKLVTCPTDEILDKFTILIEPVFEKIAMNEKQILILRQLREVLLPLLVFGKLRVEAI